MRGLWLLVAMLLALGAHLAHARIEARRDAFPDEVDVLYVPPPSSLALMSVGYREAVADLVWVRALIFSGERIGETDVDAVSRYVDAITGLSPRFHRVYLWGGVTAVYGGGERVTRPMVDRAIAIYRRGLEQFPESHEILYPLGMMLTHQVGSVPGYTEQEREAFADEGVEYIRRAASFGADPLVRQYAATLVSERGEGPLAIQFLQSQLAGAEDEDYRRMLRHRLARLGGEASIERIEQIERVRNEFMAERARQAPYVPDSIYAVIRDDRARGPSSNGIAPTRP